MSRSGLRALLEQVLLVEAGAVSVHRLCHRCGSGEHGAPSIRVASGPAPYVSLSYAGAALAAVAWSHDGPVGIDVETAGEDVGDFGDRIAWTRTEALLKTTGRGVDVLDEPLPDLPTTGLALPAGYVGTVAGTGVTWRLVRA